MKISLNAGQLKALEAFLAKCEDCEALSEKEYVLDLYDLEPPISMDLTLQKDGLWIEGAAELVFDEEMDGWYIGRRIEEAEPLLALADWTYPNTGSDDCLYLSLVRTAADGTKTYGLPMFLPLEEARRQPLLREYMAEQYGEKLSTPETVDAETLEAR